VVAFRERFTLDAIPVCAYYQFGLFLGARPFLAHYDTFFLFLDPINQCAEHLSSTGPSNYKRRKPKLKGMSRSGPKLLDL